jgi:acetoacetyl-CoA synthetase
MDRGIVPRVSTPALWTPSPERIDASTMRRFRRRAGFDDTPSLHAWSVEEPGAFWREVWDVCGVVSPPGSVAFEPGDESMLGARFFPEASLSLAENLLDGPSDDTMPAIIFEREDGQRRTMTWGQLRVSVAAVVAGLREADVHPGDRVAAWMPNLPETVIAFLATNAIGAVFSSTSADFGTAGVIDRFGQIDPVVLFAADGYTYGGRSFDCLPRLVEICAALPTLRRVVVTGNLRDEPDLGEVPGAISFAELASAGAGVLEYTRTPFDHPAAILYSSGTTGPPKCIVHRAGGLLVKHLSEQQLHCDVKEGDRVFYFTTCGWMMWNWLVSALASKATIVLYDGNPMHPGPAALFDLADRHELTLLGVSAKYIDSIAKAGLRPRDTHRLSSLRTICSTGSPLAAEGFEYVYDSVKEDVHLASISGGTDLCGCFVAGDPTRPVYAGEIQGPVLGMAVDVWNDDGTPAPAGVKGELVCTRPFPTLPIGFWGDTDGAAYRRAYFERFPGVWAHGDYASWTDAGGMVIFGRSDATLNASGVRIGTAEIYRQVDQLPQVIESVAVAQEWDGDSRIVLFVRLADGVVLDDALRNTIQQTLRERSSPRHVPAVIEQVPDIPRTRSGKISELAVADVVNGRPVRNTEALANPEALSAFHPPAVP